VLLLLLAAASACAPHKPIARRPSPPPPGPTTVGRTPTGGEKPRPKPPGGKTGGPAGPAGYVQEGLASWYGIPYHGRRAANGEIYDMYKLTAAHRTLPFETVVRVTNLKNGRSVDVRINDRGPFVEGRLIDLSLGAARAIDMVAAGVAAVRVEMLSGENPLSGSFTVQVGAFLDMENAARFRKHLEERYPPVFIVEYDAPQGLFYRVRAGRLPTEEAAREFAERLRREEQVVPFVVRLDETPPR
jgi:rare lipoprotein A